MYVTLLFLTTLLIAGCTGGGSSSGSASGSLEQFRGGSNFVSIVQEPGSPPETVFDDQTSAFDIIVRVDNNGEWDIEPNSFRVLLEGFSTQSWGQIDNNVVLANQLLGYDFFFDIDGDFEYVTFANIEYQERLAQNSFTQNYNIRSCFPYGTKVAFTACVDNEAVRSSRNDDFALCEGFSQRDFSVSSGPIGVSLIEQQVVNGRLRLIFTLNHREHANNQINLFAPNSMNEMCRVREGLSSVQTRDTVQLSLTNSIIGEFSCGSQGNARFTTSEVRITCEADISNLEQQEIPMLLEITYDTQKISTHSIRVERSN